MLPKDSTGWLEALKSIKEIPSSVMLGLILIAVWYHSTFVMLPLMQRQLAVIEDLNANTVRLLSAVLNDQSGATPSLFPVAGIRADLTQVRDTTAALLSGQNQLRNELAKCLAAQGVPSK